MKREECKIGTTVRCIGFSGDGTNIDGRKMIIFEIPVWDDYLIGVSELGQRPDCYVLPSQLRKIVKKERRSVWIPETSLPHDQICKTNDTAWVSAEPRDRWVELREVRGRKENT